jgi:hypothetical protein
MAVSYIARKCTRCAGKLEYEKEKKAWKCLYCGAEIERTEQYDGLFTIKNVVRQTLLDIAYRRPDGAEKNLTECEKIDSRYVGTIIAKIAYQMILAITPGAYPQAESRNLFRQIKRNFEALQAVGANVSDDEEALYAFFDSADVYATLLLVYDSLHDDTRRDRMEHLLNAKEVYAKEPNKNLLRYALKNAKFGLIDAIMENPDSVDTSFALEEILKLYPDDENKLKNIERLLQSQTFRDEDKRILESYLADSRDAVSTKGKIVIFAYSSNIRIGSETLIEHLLSKADAETTADVLRQICGAKLNDEDIYNIVSFAISASTADIANAALDALRDTKQYVSINSKYLIAFLSRGDLSVSDKTEILRKLLSFNVDAKAKEAAIDHYLCFNRDAGEMRPAVISVLIDAVSVMQTGTVENYILKVSVDGADKPHIVERIFSLDLNLSFFGDLLAKYINSATDPKEVRDRIVALLTKRGLKLDQRAFIDYICGDSEGTADKLGFVKKLLSDGMQLRGDAVNAYLETVGPARFDPELFALLVGSAGGISEKALTNYLLCCKDRDSLKVKNFLALAKQCHRNTADLRCDALCAGQTVSGNILPIYLIATPDSFEVTREIADYLIGCKAKLNADILSSSAGATKLKRFVSANRNSLSAVSARICAFYKIG